MQALRARGLSRHRGRTHPGEDRGRGRGHRRIGPVYFASVNYAFRYQESATSLIGPSGDCVAHLPDGQEGVLVQAIDREAATGVLAAWYAPERYHEVS